MSAERGGTEGNTNGYDGPITGVVLAGGRSRRLGRNKAMETVGDVPLISRVISAVQPMTNSLIVVVADQDQAERLPLPPHIRTVIDAYPNSGSLGGIFTGLDASETTWALVVACDMPFINAELILQMADSRTNFDLVAPVLDGRPEPIHALYSKRCLNPIQDAIQTGRLKITEFFDSVAVNYLAQDQVELIDPEHWSFFNVNTDRDLETARTRVADQTY